MYLLLFNTRVEENLFPWSRFITEKHKIKKVED